MSYVIGSGYIGSSMAHNQFFDIWCRNIMKNPDLNPSKIVVCCSKDQAPTSCPHFVQLIRVSGNLGHICRDSSQRHQLEGWACDVMITALIAYNDESDFLFIEQDCLAFGPFASTLQKECGEEGMIFGSNSWMPSAQSLFYVRHAFIPDFVHKYLGKKIADRKIGGEDAFSQMQNEFGARVKRMSFGFDRDRPPGGFSSMTNEPAPWYVQQISLAEIKQLRDCGLIE
jgi:hypothetical protein